MKPKLVSSTWINASVSIQADMVVLLREIVDERKYQWMEEKWDEQIENYISNTRETLLKQFSLSNKKYIEEGMWINPN